MAGKKTTIILTQEDVPSKLQLLHAASRLRKDYELLKKSKGNKNTEDPSSMAAVANFLEMLVKRESRNLRKDEQEASDPHIRSMLDIAVDYFRSLPQEQQDGLLQQGLPAHTTEG